jgi:GT2 family glycosyltransferase
MHDYSITFACYNSVEYTKRCVNSLISSGTPMSRVIVVDNGSHDGTQNYLKTQPFGEVIFNKSNLGCGTAWNQGALAQQAEWTIIMNNDVVVTEGWAERLIESARELDVKVVSPAMIEGPLDYDFQEFAKEAERRMSAVSRLGAKHAVCLAVHKSVWEDIGYFTPKPRLLGYEDTIFFNELEKAGIQTAITGAVWFHHFGSVTQDQMKKEKGLAMSQALGERKNYKMLGMNWFERKIRRFRRKKSESLWRKTETQNFNMTVHGLRQSGDFVWR